MSTLTRHLDLVVLAVALPLFVLVGLPVAGWAIAATAWLVQKLVQIVIDRKVAASDDPRTIVGLTGAGMIGRGMLAAVIVLSLGIPAGDAAGLSAVVLVLILFSAYFATRLATRPPQRGSLT